MTNTQPLGEIVLTSRWLTLEQYKQRLMKEQLVIHGKNLTESRNLLLEHFIAQIRQLSQDWEKDIKIMNTTTDYERGYKQGQLDLINKRLLS